MITQAVLALADLQLAEAVAFFKSIGETYKAEIIASIPSSEPISLYGQGNWIDLSLEKPPLQAAQPADPPPAPAR